MRENIKKRIEAIRRGEVPEGYHKDYCLMPIEWNSTELKNIAKKVSQKNRGGEDVAVLSNSAVRGVVLQREYFEKDIANNENTDGYFVVEPGDYIYNPRISVNAPFGPIKRNNLGHKGIVSPLYTVFRPKRGELVDERYLEYFFLSTQWNRFVYTVSNQGVRFDRMNITDDDFFCMSIAVPPLAEQQKIAEILATCDRVIELKQQLLEEKRRQKQWLMQKLLDPNSGVRMPGFECTKWAEMPLASICKFVGGGTPDTSNEHYWNGTIPWLSSADLQDGNVHSVQATRFITEEAVKNSATKICPKDSILIVSRVGVGKIAIAPVDLCTSQDFTNLVDVKGNLYFITLQIQREIQRILAMSQGTSIKGIASKEIKAVTINLPSRGEQDAIARVVECSDKEIDLCEKEIEVWQQKKKAMMQLLLTGLVRVND